jgi:hypothetical protein
MTLLDPDISNLDGPALQVEPSLNRFGSMEEERFIKYGDVIFGGLANASGGKQEHVQARRGFEYFIRKTLDPTSEKGPTPTTMHSKYDQLELLEYIEEFIKRATRP